MQTEIFKDKEKNNNPLMGSLYSLTLTFSTFNTYRPLSRSNKAVGIGLETFTVRSCIIKNS